MISFETSTVHNERGYCEAGHEISFVSKLHSFSRSTYLSLSLLIRVRNLCRYFLTLISIALVLVLVLVFVFARLAQKIMRIYRILFIGYRIGIKETNSINDTVNNRKTLDVKIITSFYCFFFSFLPFSPFFLVSFHSRNSLIVRFIMFFHLDGVSWESHIGQQEKCGETNVNRNIKRLK